MSIDHIGPQQEAGNRVDYDSLRAEATPFDELKNPDHLRAAERDPKIEDYEAVSQRIRSQAEYNMRRGVPMRELIPELKDTYCDGEDNQTLRSFNELMIDTIAASRYQTKLDQMNNAGTLNSHDTELKKQLVYRRCEFNHLLRDVVAAGRDELDRATISSFIGAAAGGTPRAFEFAHRAVDGVVSELAVMDALGTMPGVTFAQFADIESDLRGVDIAIKTVRGWAAIDVKTSAGRPETRWQSDRPHLTIHVDPLRVEGSRPSDKIIKELQSEIGNGLVEAYSKAPTQKSSRR